ncbi:hypothetical protein [Actinosynnema sp. NPDC020468]|uniref:hypothetical protein n=1 Tax=Actinosynnema sp. NPDC020468 TaxID=3154488 RepID=UPI0033E09285
MRTLPLLLVLLAVACQSAAAPPGGRTVALRAEVVGGGPRPPGLVDHPAFVLYGDRTLIVSLGAEPLVREYHLTTEEFDRLYGRARDAGLDRAETHDDPVPDAGTLVVTFGSDAGTAVTRVTPPDRSATGRAGEIARAVALDPDADLTSPFTPYRPERVAVVAVETDATAAAPPWPLRPLADGTPVATGRCATYPAADVAAVRTGSSWSDRGTTYTVTRRPLLPDEPDCGPLTPR